MGKMTRFPGLVLSLALMLPPAAQAEIDNEPYPLEYWALRAVIDQAQVSPDGKYLGLMKIPSKDGNPIIEVYEADDLTKEPFRLNADPMEITNFYWASDEDIIFTLRQKVRDIVEGQNEGVYQNKIASVNVRTQRLREFEETNASIVNIAPGKPNKVIISFQEGGDDGPGSKIGETFRPQSYWLFDLKKGTKQLLIRGKLALGNIEFNGNGEPWGARGFDAAKGDFIWYVRRSGASGWEEIYRVHESEVEDFFIESIDPTSTNHVLVSAQNGHDKLGFWSFNINTKKFDELIYRRSDVDVLSARYHSNDWQNPDTVVGINYFTDKQHTEYFDEIEGATYAQLEQFIPHSHYVNINSRSRDGGTMTIYNSGPRDPGTYYLLKNGKITPVGSRQPLLESEKLADLEYVTFEARDGLKLRAYVTLPNGKPPYPTIVMPHGGPWVRETPVFSEWAQMLANNGYMVVQPQYRGSLNYGLNFHLIAWINGGEAGYKMQDDKDDSALHLVERGLADPDRIAMFGWSYGGYAALAAASRTPQIYQCTMAGAAVADMIQQHNFNLRRYRDNSVTKRQQEIYRREALNPIDEVAKVNIPILIIHGDLDQRVQVVHAKRYMKELDKHNKYYKYVELEGADHFSNTLFFHHQIELYESMLDFLANDCGNMSLRADAEDTDVLPDATVANQGRN